MLKPTLTLADYRRAAQTLGCEVAMIMAIAQKESGTGFIRRRILTVRFEGHIFRRLTGGVYDLSHPTLSHRYMADCPYNLGTIGDWRRLEEARQLAGDVAFECASYGKFQVMGFNYALLGYESAYALVQAFNAGEGPHLDGFVKFIQGAGLVRALQNKQFARIADRYNGTNSAANNYAPDIEKLYEQLRVTYPG